MMGALSAGAFSNIFIIPLDQFRIRVAADVVGQNTILSHFKQSFRSPQAAFTGAIAR
jgi:hypothetical protein